MGPSQLVEDLKKDLAAGRVLVIAGTGVSMQASGNDPRAGWAGLIRDGINRCERLGRLKASEAAVLRERLDRERTNTALIAIAKEIETKLKGRELKRWLKESVGKLPLAKPELIDVIHALGAKVATTNYDDLLSRGRDLEAIPWNETADVLEWINGARPGVLHFHGFYDEPDSVILGEGSYRDLLAARGAQDLQKVAAAINTLLFIGCGSDGLADPNFGALLDWFATEFKTSIYRHYGLCLESERETLAAKHPALEFIEYGEKFDDLTASLRDLVPPRRPPVTLLAPPRCFGRGAEVKTLVAALLRKNPDPIPILGGPGMGKTTIALTAIHDRKIAKKFGARRWFVRCDSAKTRAEVVAAIAIALGIEIRPELEPQVLDELARTPGALILDNAETPLDGPEKRAVEEFLSVLAGLDSLALVVTIRGQHRPVTVPWGSTIEANRLSEEAARAAFLAASGRPAFAKDPDLAKLLGALDGAPLPITLMGRFAESFKSLDLVWQRWDAKKTAMLSEGDDRLTNIAISYELSIEALTPEARRLLFVLAMLPDGAAHIDLQALFPDPDRATDELRRRALIEDEATRVRMLAPLREHVAAAHAPEPEDEQRAFRHYLSLANKEGSKVGAEGGAEATIRLAPEVANVETALTRSAIEEGALLRRAVYGWTELVRFSGLGSGAAFEQVRARAAAAGATVIEARCLQSLGDIALHRSEHQIARTSYEAAIPLFQATGDEIGEANCIQRLGDIALQRSDHDTARARYEEALPLFRKVGELRGEANCIQRLGDIALDRSDHDTARARYEEALPLFRKVGALLGEANCIQSLGEIALERSDHDTASARYEEALPLYRKVGVPLGEANCIKSLGDIALERSDHDTAHARYEEALPLYRKVGALLGEANCIRSLGGIALERSDHHTARARYEEALPLYRKVGSLLGEANCIQSLGDIALASDNGTEAGARFGEALALYERRHEPYSIGWTHVRLARLASGDAKKAHVDTARAAWRGIKREDLVAELDAEFGEDEGTRV